MPFKEGNKHGRGRKKGSQNKKTAENRERVNNVLNYLHEQHLYDDLKDISSSERVKTYIALMEYSLPKLQRIAHTGPNDDRLKIEIQVVDASDEENKDG